MIRNQNCVKQIKQITIRSEAHFNKVKTYILQKKNKKQKLSLH